MLHPAPTTTVDPLLTRGVLDSIIDATATKPAFIVLSFYNTNYKTRFRATDADIERLRPSLGKRVLGRASVGARKIAECKTGGRYIEPVYGAPQRAQGKIVAITEQALVIDAGGPKLHVEPTHPEQALGAFEAGQMITFDAQEGATFEPVS